MRLGRAIEVARARFAEKLGYHDTGLVVTGTASEARRLSRMELHGGSVAGPATDVRPLSGRERSHIVPRREGDFHRRANRLVAWLFAMAFCAVVARQQSGPVPALWQATSAVKLLSRPTVLVAKLSSRGGVLRPERPYSSFGEAGGTVSLWDEPAGKALQMPAEQVRLVPAADGRVRCTFSYETLPKGG